MGRDSYLSCFCLVLASLSSLLMYFAGIVTGGMACFSFVVGVCVTVMPTNSPAWLKDGALMDALRIW